MTGNDDGPAGVLQTLRELPIAARFVLLGVFVNQFGAFLQLFLVLYLTQRGFTAGQAGIALGAYSVGAILGVLFGGGVSDRLGPRWTIVLATGSAALFTLSVIALDLFPAIVVVVALAGAMTQASRPAASALLFGMVPEGRRVMVFAMYRTALMSATIAGPLMASWLSTISWDLVFWFDAVAALLYCAIAAFLLRGRGTGPAGEPAVDTPPASYLTLFRDRRYLVYLLLMFANGLVHIQFFAVLPLMLTRDGHETWVYALATTITASITVGSELLITKVTQTWAAWIAVITGWTMLVIGRGAYGLPGGLTLIFIATGFAAVGTVIGGPAAFAYPAKVAPPGAVGRYLGSAHATFQLGYAIGPIVGVLLWNGLGNGFWAIVVAFGLAMIGPGIWAMRPPDGRERTVDDTTAEPETVST